MNPCERLRSTGFTLLEVMAAVAVLGFVYVVVYYHDRVLDVPALYQFPLGHLLDFAQEAEGAGRREIADEFLIEAVHACVLCSERRVLVVDHEGYPELVRGEDHEVYPPFGLGVGYRLVDLQVPARQTAFAHGKRTLQIVAPTQPAPQISIVGDERNRSTGVAPSSCTCASRR